MNTTIHIVAVASCLAAVAGCSAAPVGQGAEAVSVQGASLRGIAVSSPSVAPEGGAPVGAAGSACDVADGRQQPACAPELYCSFAASARCGADEGAAGVCAAKPRVCPEIYRPVCGCDGNTYGNACFAAMKGVNVDRLGACDAGTEGKACGGFLGLRCADGLFCNFPVEMACGEADGIGVCTKKTEVCTREYRPVCGCDRHTYANACEAFASGVSIFARGECTAN